MAEAIARAAHAGQVDKSGAPYIEHVARVAAAVEARYRAVAWLHDVLEDTAVTEGDLAAQGLPQDVIEAVVAITRRQDEEPDAYYARVRASEAALATKAADLADNANPTRLAVLDEPTRTRLVAKYDHARRALGLGGPQ